MKILDKLPESVAGLIINECDDCPFDDGTNYEYAIMCNAGATPKEKSTKKWLGTPIPKDCPLTEVADAEVQ